MFFRRLDLSGAALALVVTLFGCGEAPRPVTGIDQPVLADLVTTDIVGASIDSAGLPLDSTLVAPDSVTDDSGERYKLVRSGSTDLRQASAWIDKEGGVVQIVFGTVNRQPVAHTLNVPKNAVTRPTLFTIRVASRKYVSVHLTAQERSSTGALVDVGHLGFRAPVALHLTYAVAINLKSGEVPRLAVLYDPEDGRAPHRMKSFVAPPEWNSPVVAAELPHFSKYILVVD